MMLLHFEATKLYEKQFRNTVRALYEDILEKQKQSFLKGELTIVIAPYTPDYNFNILGHTDYKGHDTKDLYKEWNDEATKTF
jgi:hypothetical protein